MPNLLLFGPPGSGKTTQAVILAKRLNGHHISIGALLRKEVQHQTDLGLKTQQKIENGEMVDDHHIRTILSKRLAELKPDEPFILDGFPRTPQQIPLFDELFPDGLQAISLQVSDENIKKRLLARGRKDDTVEIIERRIARYKTSTVPVIEHFESKGLVHKIDGNRAIEETANAISALTTS